MNDGLSLNRRRNDPSLANRSTFITVATVALILGAVSLLAVTPAAASHNYDDGYNWANTTYDDLPPQMKQEFSRAEIVGLFSSDTEPSEGTPRYNRTVENADTTTETLRIADATYDRPPRLVERWNQHSLSRYRQNHRNNGGLDNSIFPYDTKGTYRVEYIAPRDGTPYDAYLKTNRRVWGDGHLSIMSVQPSTVVHESWLDEGNSRHTNDGGDVKRLYIKKNGSVYVSADVRIEDIPDDRRTNVTCASYGDCQAQTKYVYGHNHTDWENVRLQVSTGSGQYTTLSTASQTSPNEGAFALNYSLPQDVVGPRHFRVAGTINVTLDRTKYTWEKTGTKEVSCNPRGSDCPKDGNKTVDVYEWVKQNVVQINSFSKPVDDTISIFRPRGFDHEDARPTVKIAHLPNGETQVRVDVKGANSQGRATRNPYWSRMSLWTTHPTRTELTVPTDSGRANVSNVGLRRNISSGTQMKIWARGDFDTFSETFTVTVNGVQVYSGRTGHEDTLAGKRHPVKTVDIPRRLHGMNSVNITVETSGQVEAEGGFQPRFWFEIEHAPVPVENTTLYTSTANGTATVDCTNRKETYQTHCTGENNSSRTYTTYDTNATGTRALAQLESQWMFFSARDKGWDELWRGNEDLVIDNHKKTTSPVRPVYVHAFPSAVGERSRSVSGLTWLYDEVYNSSVGDYVPERKTAPRLNKGERCSTRRGDGHVGWCNFAVNVANASPNGTDHKTYIQKTGAVFNTSEETDHVVVYGMVRGQNVSAEVVEERSVGLVVVDTEVKDVASYDGGRKATVTFTLKTQNGEPVNTDGRDLHGEYLRVVNGSASQTSDGNYTYSPARVETNASGKVTTTVYLPEDGDGKVYVRYVSPPWWEVPHGTRPYMQMSSEESGKSVTAEQIMGSAYVVGTILVIPLILFYLVLKKFGIDLGIGAYKELLGTFIDGKILLVLILGLLTLYLFA